MYMYPRVILTNNIKLIIMLQSLAILKLNIDFDENCLRQNNNIGINNIKIDIPIHLYIK